MPTPDRTCLTPDCKGTSATITKGLCQTCYREAKQMVDRGETTWEQLASVGLALGPPSKFRAAFNSRYKNEGD